MKVSRVQANANRERVVEASSELFRERGFAEVGLNELMQAAGLTRGGFYGQFESKQDLVNQAMAKGMDQSLARWKELFNAKEHDALQEFINRYLSDKHFENRASGCTLAALGSDVSRQDTGTKEVFENGLRNLADLIGSVVPTESAETRQQTWTCLSALVGALILSRAVANPELSAEIREATASSLQTMLTHNA